MTKIKTFAGTSSSAGKIAGRTQDAANEWLRHNAERVIVLDTQTCATFDPSGVHSFYLTITYKEAEVPDQYAASM